MVCRTMDFFPRSTSKINQFLLTEGKVVFFLRVFKFHQSSKRNWLNISENYLKFERALKKKKQEKRWNRWVLPEGVL